MVRVPRRRPYYAAKNNWVQLEGLGCISVPIREIETESHMESYNPEGRMELEHNDIGDMDHRII
jgi:hypothetical protein